jgi:hypothetical protein
MADLVFNFMLAARRIPRLAACKHLPSIEGNTE